MSLNAIQIETLLWNYILPSNIYLLTLDEKSGKKGFSSNFVSFWASARDEI